MTDSHDDQLLKQLGERARDAQSRAALRPLDDAFNARMQQQIKTSLQNTSHDVETPNATMQTARPTRWLALAASAVAAIGLSFVMLTRDAIAPLPGYELALSGGAKMRSDDTRAPLQLGDKITATWRPAIDTDAELDIEIYRQADDGWAAVPATVAIAPSGAALVTVFLNEEAGVEAGPQDWWFVLGRSGAMPHPEQLPAGNSAREDDWTAFRERFELVP